MSDDRLISWIREYAAAAECRGLPGDALWLRFRESGDGHAFRVLVERLGPRVYQVCYAVLADRHLAEDAFQETFALLALRRVAIPTFAGAKAWVRTAAGLTARHVRRNRVRRTSRERPLVDVAVTSVRPEPDEAGRVTAALVELPARYRRPLELVYWDGLTHAEAAAELGWSKGTVDSYIARGLAKLRAKLRAAGAVVAAALSAPAPALSPGAFARLSGGPPAAGGWGTGKLVIPVGLSLAGVVGIGVGGWLWSPAPAPDHPAPPAAVTESVPDRTLRVFRADVLPALLAALRPAALNGGEIELGAVDAYDARLDAEFVLRHRTGGGRGWRSRIRFVRDTTDRATWVLFDLSDTGSWRRIDPARPVVLWKNPLTGSETVLPNIPLANALAAFDPLPADDRAAAEAAAARDRIRAALSRYAGTWYRNGDRAKPAEVAVRDGRPYLGWREAATGFEYGFDVFGLLRVRPDGCLVGAGVFDSPAVFAADGRRIDFPQTGEWWERAPGGR